MTMVFGLLQHVANYYSQTKWFRNRLRFLGWGCWGVWGKKCIMKITDLPSRDPTPFMKTLANQSTEQNLIQFWGKHLPAVEAQGKKDASYSGANKGGERKWE